MSREVFHELWSEAQKRDPRGQVCSVACYCNYDASNCPVEQDLELYFFYMPELICNCIIMVSSMTSSPSVCTSRYRWNLSEH